MNKKPRILMLMLSLMLMLGISTMTASAAKMSKKTLKMPVAQSYQLKVKGTKKAAIWSSSNPYVAVVSNKGLVVAKRKGKTTITAKIGKKKYKCKVSVYENKYVPGANTLKPGHSDTAPFEYILRSCYFDEEGYFILDIDLMNESDTTIRFNKFSQFLFMLYNFKTKKYTHIFNLRNVYGHGYTELKPGVSYPTRFEIPPNYLLTVPDLTKIKPYKITIAFGMRI